MYTSCQKFSKGAETCPNFKNNWEDAVPVQGQCLSGTLTCRPCLLLDMTLTGNLGTCFAVFCGGTTSEEGFHFDGRQKRTILRLSGACVESSCCEMQSFLARSSIRNAVYMPYQKRLQLVAALHAQRAATHPKNDLYQGIENAVYMSCQKFSKGAETCPNFKNNNLAYYKSVENVGYISCQKR